MPFPQLDRRGLTLHPLAERRNRQHIEPDHLTVADQPADLSRGARETVAFTVERMRAAREAGRPVVLAFGAHAIKNGLGPVLIRLMEEGWVQHLATNGAGIIHDWEFSFQGMTSEDVAVNTAAGRFGIWEETGRHLNLAILLGALDGLGYGEAVGRFIETGLQVIPSRAELLEWLVHASEDAQAADRAAAAADLLAVMLENSLEGRLSRVPHPWKRHSVQAAAYRLGVPFTAHPMIGHDIIYTHPLNSCAAIGRAAQRDFLSFARTISNIDGGAYLSVGSAVMSPMIFEKSLSMAQNLALQEGTAITDHAIVVVDLAESTWDWSQGEPPTDSPDYYLRYCKTFSRMGGTMRYATADNRDFLLQLCHDLGLTA
jgi:hypothetical protein